MRWASFFVVRVRMVRKVGSEQLTVGSSEAKAKTDCGKFWTSPRLGRSTLRPYNGAVRIRALVRRLAS